MNVFYLFSALWSFVLILYSLKFSDLCTKIDVKLLIFFIIAIISSFIIGKICKKKFVYNNSDIKQKSKCKLMYIFIILYVIEFLIENKIPLMNVMRGHQYNTISFRGIPFLHIFIGAASIYYSFYLSFLYSIQKQKRLLFYNLIIIMYFLLLVQRQNVLICFLGFISMLCYTNFSKISLKIKNNKKIIIIAVVMLSLLLYCFGIFGNIRYGSKWEWNDTSMIETLGRKNDRYPTYISKQYFWSYLYMISPVVNLNYNIKNNNSDENIVKYAYEYVPTYIRDKMNYNQEKVLLPVPSLTASTAYVRAYKYMGYLGMYIMLFVQLFVSYIIISISYRKNKNLYITNSIAVGYFLLFTFFTNTFVYTTTSIILLISIILSFKYKIK